LAQQARGKDVGYAGMDIDLESVAWCQKHITPNYPKFKFYHVDGISPSYNPNGLVDMSTYQFPHVTRSFDLILATSLFTHTPAAELDHYFAEIARLLQPDGILYATFFIYRESAELQENRRHPIRFSSADASFAVNNEQRPTDAIAFREEFLLSRLAAHELELLSPVRYGTQEILVIRKKQQPFTDVSLGDGWYELEQDCWRWTAPNFALKIHSSELGDRVLRFRFTVPEEMFKGSDAIWISAEANGAFLVRQSCTSPGPQVCTSRIPAGEVDLSFQVENSVRLAKDPRPLGVQVIFAEDHSRLRNPFSVLPLEAWGNPQP
jgi:SAM-dependent methyltransferase